MSAARAGALPRLEAFDDEFGHEETESLTLVRPNPGFKLSTVIGLALAAGVISALALGWPNGPEGDKSMQAAVEKPEAAVARLTDEVAMLRRELKELTEEHQRAAATIATLQAEQGNRALKTWYSDPAALMHGFDTHSEANAASTVRRSVVRARPREVTPPREEGTPLTLDPQ
jgi:hypothetical protein